MVEYWRRVRAETLAYLRSLSPKDLRSRPRESTLPEDDGNRDNPVRELFIMAIKDQNCHWGDLRSICKILDVPTRW